ncbi:hypothetical protein AHAS_Ahas06G0047800 [Arachis hypogaea]
MQPNRNLLVRKLDPPQTWNPIVENYLRATGFYHVSRIGVIRGFHPMLATLVERWRPETHTFVLSIGEVTVTLEDVAHIFGLPIDGEAISGWTDSSGEFVQSQGIAIFGREPSVSGNAKSYVKLGWVRRIRDAELLDTDEVDFIHRQVNCICPCDSGFTQRQRGYAVVDTFNPGPSAPAEAGGSAAPTEAGGSAAPTDASGSVAPTEAGGSGALGVDDSVRGHPYDLRTERNLPDRIFHRVNDTVKRLF